MADTVSHREMAQGPATGGIPLARIQPGIPGRLTRPADIPKPRPRRPASDAVTFTAPCPRCGLDCDWDEHREDTRTRVAVGCPCRGPQV